MRAVVVHPGANFSVADVHAGWIKALGRYIDVFEYDYAARLGFWDRVYVKNETEDRYVPAFQLELVARLALEGLGTALWELDPDLVFIISGLFIDGPAVDVMRKRGVKVVLLCTESPYEDDRQVALAAHCDAVLVNDPTNIETFAAVNPNTRYVPHSYDPEIHRPDGPSVPSDVVMAGTGYPSRVEFITQVDWSGIDLALLGNWSKLPDGSPLRAHVRHDLAWEGYPNAATVDWYRGAQAGFNLYRKEAQRDDLTAGWSMGPREIELAACGTFYMTEPRGENLEVLPFVPKFESPAQFSEEIRWWLDRPHLRDEVAQKARETVAGWTFENRARQLLVWLSKLPAKAGV